MIEESEKYELIERYLQGELSKPEAEQFESRLLHDDEFEEEVQRHKEAQKVIIDRDLLRIRDKLKTIMDADKSEKKAERTAFKARFPKKYAIAAAIAILAVSTAVLYIITDDEATPQELFADYFEPAPAVYVRNDTDTLITNRRRALNLYSTGKYEEAILEFEKILKTEPDNIEAVFYLGNCYLSVNQPLEAEKYFPIVIENKENHFISEARWFLAMSRLGAGKPDEAAETLHLIIDAEDEIYIQRAEELLEKLKEIEGEK